MSAAAPEKPPPTLRVKLAAAIAGGAATASLALVSTNPRLPVFRDENRWPFVHWPLLERWGFGAVVFGFGLALGLLGAGGSSKPGRIAARIGGAMALVAVGTFAAMAAALTLPREMGSVGGGLGGLVMLGVNATAVIVFVLAAGCFTLVGGFSAFGVGFAAGALGRGREAVGVGVTLGALLFVVGTMPDAAAPHVALAGLVITALAATTALPPKTRAALVGGAALLTIGAGARIPSAITFERDRLAHTLLLPCFPTMGDVAARDALLARMPELADAIVLQGADNAPLMTVLPIDPAKAEGVVERARATLGSCRRDAHFDPDVAVFGVELAKPTPVTFTVVSDEEHPDAPKVVAETERLYRAALAPRRDVGPKIRGYGAEPSYLLPGGLPPAVIPIHGETTSATGAHVTQGAMLELEPGSYAAFGRVNLLHFEELDSEGDARTVARARAVRCPPNEAPKTTAERGDGAAWRKCALAWSQLVALFHVDEIRGDPHRTAVDDEALRRDEGPEEDAVAAWLTAPETSNALERGKMDLRWIRAHTSGVDDGRALLWAGRARLASLGALGIPDANAAERTRLLAIGWLQRAEEIADPPEAALAASGRALGLALATEPDEPEIERAFDRALALDPTSALVRVDRASWLGRDAGNATELDKLLTEARANTATDPSRRVYDVIAKARAARMSPPRP